MFLVKNKMKITQPNISNGTEPDDKGCNILHFLQFVVVKSSFVTDRIYCM